MSLNAARRFAFSQSAVATIMDRSYLRPGGGIAAVESYHAGAVRTLLLQNASTIVQPFGVSVASICEVRCPPIMLPPNSSLMKSSDGSDACTVAAGDALSQMEIPFLTLLSSLRTNVLRQCTIRQGNEWTSLPAQQPCPR